MLCEKCQHQNATVFLTQIVGGKMQKIDLCESCARELGVTSNAGFSLQDLLLKSNALAADPPKNESAFGQDSCPECGSTEADVRRVGRFGCPACYGVFTGFLDEVLANAQKGPRHQGKVPEAARSLAVRQRHEELERAIEAAVRGEDYERAARLRDELRLLGNAVG